MLRLSQKLINLSRRSLMTNTSCRQSQLGVAFNQIPTPNTQQKNFKIKLPFVNNTSKSNGLFGKKELGNYDGFFELEKRAATRVNELIDEAFSPETNNKRKLVEIFDDISNELCCVADLAEFVRTSHPNVNYRQSANMIFGQISQLVEKLNTNLDLYKKLKQSVEDEDLKKKLDDCDVRVCKLFLADFEQSGIHLDTATRTKFVAINDQLVNLLMKFQINSQQPSIINSNEVNEKYKCVLNYFRDPIQIDTMYINSDNELVREFVYKSFLQENKVQEMFFRSIIEKRKEIANLCGFESYSHRANINMIMDTPSKIMEFLDQCSKTIEQKSLEDFDQMRQFKKKYLNSSQPLSQWDVPIIISRMKKNTFDLDRTHYLNYFSLGTVMEGLNMILNNVFKVNLEIENLNQEESWHSDIYKLAVKDSNNTLLGYIYCDFYNRNDKFSNVDCHFTIQCSKLLADKSYQIPIVVLHLNFPLPSPNRPTLLSFEMMENLFHEFGHAMHSMFAKTRYQHVSGTRCSTDFAEVPSQLMEFYCRDPRVLKQIAKHYITQEPLDDKTIHKLCKSKKMFASSELQNQILNSVLDQVFHLNELENSKTIDLIEKYTNKYHCLGYVKNTNWHLRYTHLVGYGAKYYSYLVSKALATKIWAECFEKDPLNSNAGEMYRQKLLQFGGEKRPEELINSLIGLDIHSSSLVDSLTNNI